MCAIESMTFELVQTLLICHAMSSKVDIQLYTQEGESLEMRLASCLDVENASHVV